MYHKRELTTGMIFVCNVFIVVVSLVLGIYNDTRIAVNVEDYEVILSRKLLN